MNAIAAYSATEAALTDLATKYKGVVYDVTTASGMAEAKKARGEIREHRTTLEKARVKEKAQSLEYGRFVDTEAKRIADRIAALEDPIAGMIKAEEQKAELARQEAVRIEAERLQAVEAAKRKAEEDRIAQANAEIARRQAELDLLESKRIAAEAEARRKIEAEQRESRRLIEEEERKSRLAREEADRAARKIREAEELELKAERERIEKERRAIEDRERKEREAKQIEANRVRAQEEEAARELQRQKNEILDAQQMLESFCSRFGHLKQFESIVGIIESFLQKKAA